MATTRPAGSTSFEDFLAKKEQLNTLIGKQLHVLSELQMSAWQWDVSKLRKRMLSDSFKVLVMGEFNRGKSTFINALLGQEVLPAYVIPTTAIINEVKWGQTKRAILHFLAGEDGVTKEPLEIPVEQLEQYVIIQESKGGSYGDQQVTYQSPYEKVELFWPLDLCRDGVEIIDSPGLNEDVERQKITLEYLKTVDVVLFVVACDFALSRSEMLVLETIQAAGHEHAFFIFNRINLIKAKERDQVIKRCIDMVVPFAKGGQNNIFFIDALGALEGRLEYNAERIKQSNIESVEGRLKMFLARERGRVKLLRPSTELRSAVREAWRTLPEREQLLRTDLATLQERYSKAQDNLALLQEEQRNIYTLLTSSRTVARQQVFNAATAFYSDVAYQVPGWTEGYKLQDPIKLQQIFSSRARERVVEEVITYLTDRVRREFEGWKTETFEPLLTQLVNALASQLDERTKRFADGLEQVRTDLATDATTEAAFDFNEMLKSIIPQLTVTVVTVALVDWNPIILIPPILLGSAIQAVFKTNAINQKIRDDVGKEYAAKLRESRDELANAIASSLEQELKEIQDAVGKRLGLELQNIRDQVSSVIKMKEEEQHKVNQALQGLKAIQDELYAIDSELDNFINLVALTKADL